MEKKTMGSLIAALRRSNGMTQKDLAERLNVSDKTVSRWERDEGAPDLSAIPVLAEIFGITCDELLRGECDQPEQRSRMQFAQSTEKGEKQRRRLLKQTVSNYQIRCWVAMGIAVVGWIAALICNLAFLKGLLGFWLGTIFFVGAVLCQLVFINRAFLSVEDAELSLEENREFHKKVTAQAEISLGFTMVLLGSILPLLLTDSYTGLQAGSLLLYGTAGGIAALVLVAVVCWLLNAHFIRSGRWELTEKAAVKYRKNHRLQKWYAIILCVVLAAIFALHQATTELYGPLSIVEGIAFEDYDSFVAYMEQDIPAQVIYYGPTAPIPSESVGDPVYYDQYGNEIPEEQAKRRTLEDKNVVVVCEYIKRNENAVSIRYTAGDSTVLPITVCTQEQMDTARQLAARRDQLFAVIYPLEAAVMLAFYWIKRTR